MNEWRKGGKTNGRMNPFYAYKDNKREMNEWMKKGREKERKNKSTEKSRITCSFYAYKENKRKMNERMKKGRENERKNESTDQKEYKVKRGIKYW